MTLDARPSRPGLSTHLSRNGLELPVSLSAQRLLRSTAGTNTDDAAHVVGMSETAIQKLLTTKDLAEILQVPVRTIEDWRTRQYGPKAIHFGKRVRYRPSDVEAWLESAA